MYKDIFRACAFEATKSQQMLKQIAPVVCYNFFANFSTMAGTAPAFFFGEVSQ